MTATAQCAPLLPRKYQEEIFCRARRENIIAALDTGSGKTFISTLLIKHVATSLQGHCKIIFLVPTVVLVEQQSDYLEEHTGLRVSKLQGVVDLSDRRVWRNLFRSFDCFVMTAQIYYNLLTHSHWSLEKTSLLIFDECHRARGNDPYMKIMREYFHLKSTSRPKIFGMTASPLWSAKDPIGDLEAFEKAMDCKVIGVKDHVKELDSHAPKPKETVIEYAPCPTEFTYPHPTLMECLQVFSFWEYVNDIPWRNIIARYYNTFNNLGPFCAELYLYNDMKSKLKDLAAALQRQFIQSSSQQISSEEYHAVLEIMNDFAPVLDDDTLSSLIIHDAWFTPKLHSLISILKDSFSPTSQGIVFVNQRQNAYCLAKALPAFQSLEDRIKCRCLTGDNESGFSASGLGSAKEAVGLFRRKEINLLIATSVAEEGLDFPACDVVIRFDMITNMIAYVQSRGRARNRSSDFFIMLEAGDTASRDRYEVLCKSEPEIRKAYQVRHKRLPSSDGDAMDVDSQDSEADEFDPIDPMQRERLFIESTGAVLTYDNAIELLDHLCALLPKDEFTPVHLPKYSIFGCFNATVVLPSTLPLPSAELKFNGLEKRSKKEAKRAAAFVAVKQLYELDVFDSYLLPVPSADEDTELENLLLMAPGSKKSKIPTHIIASVRDPFVTGDKIWIHPVHINGTRVAGLVTGARLPSTSFWHKDSVVRVLVGIPLSIHADQDVENTRKIMEDFTKACIWHFVSRKKILSSIPLFLLPVVEGALEVMPDFEAMNLLLRNPRGISDWSTVYSEACDKLVVVNRNHPGYPYLLHNIRNDLTPLSPPLLGSKEADDGHESYLKYFLERWAWKKPYGGPFIPSTGPMIEVLDISPQKCGQYFRFGPSPSTATAPMGRILPQGCCSWLPLTPGVRNAYMMLLPMTHRVSGAFRAYHARHALGLPSIEENLLIEALTIPQVGAGYNNQRLETLGDGVLQLLSTVHLFNRFPNRHEGQLTDFRKKLVCNATLRRLALDTGLPAFIISEVHQTPRWAFTGKKHSSCLASEGMKHSVLRSYPARSLQDCMEAILGAAFVTGGVPMALQCGTSLGMAFGGTAPWGMRNEQEKRSFVPAKNLFTPIQEQLGYVFIDGSLLTEAVTHASLLSNRESAEVINDTSINLKSYERLEFLGDALIDLVVTEYLYDKFPKANSELLTRMRARVICSPALAYLSVCSLSLQTLILCNSLDLTNAINEYVPILQEMVTPAEIVRDGWKYDPPKPLSDVAESVFGAVLVDSGWDYERAKEMVLHVMGPLLEQLDPAEEKDPVSMLLEWAGMMRCSQVSLRKSKPTSEETPYSQKLAAVVVCAHGTEVIEPVSSPSRRVARGLAAEKALKVLRDEEMLVRICDCRVKKIDTPLASGEP